VAAEADSDSLAVNMDLVNGIALSGRVLDQDTGRPPKSAMVEYFPLFPNAYASDITCLPNLPASSATVQPDGSYTLAALPGPGVVLVAASPRQSYAVAMIDHQQFAELLSDSKHESADSFLRTAYGARSPGTMCINKYNALALINPRDDKKSLTINLKLQQSPALQGAIVGPDGQPLAGATVTGLTPMPEDRILETHSFFVTALNPARKRELIFHHREKGLGKTLIVDGTRTEPLTVRLDTWPWVVGRIVDRSGKPMPPLRISFRRRDPWIDTSIMTDHEGHFRVSLLPGNYSLGARLFQINDVADQAPGQAGIQDLGDVVLK
jgi:hypothetical protein